MKKALIDINIIIDMLNGREHHMNAAKIFDACINRRLDGYLCSHEITTLSYFIEKYKFSYDKKNLIIMTLLDSFTILPATEIVLRKALTSPINDYGDAVIDVSVSQNELDYIVTNNLKDFKKGFNTCLTADQMLQLM
jgi:predicted nucleic acid-binding protein